MNKVKIISVNETVKVKGMTTGGLIEDQILKLINQGLKKRDIISQLVCDEKVYKRVMNRERNRRWREKNPDVIRDKQSRWYLKNSEKVKNDARKWRMDNHERYKQINRDCKERRRKDKKIKELLMLKEGLKNIKVGLDNGLGIDTN